MKIASRISRIEASKTLQVKEKALELKAKGLKVIDLTAGEPDFPTPAFICSAGIEAIQQGFTKYTANNGIPELRKRICEKLKTENGLEYTPEQIIVSSGAKQSILNALLAILDEDDEVILPSPYWVSYPEQIKIAGGRPVVVDTSHHAFKITPQILAMKITEKTRAFILNSPCNPTGVIYSREELKDLAIILQKHDIWIITDEIYEKIIFDDSEHVSIGTFGDLINKSILINGVSKTYSMTGWRLGFAAGPLPVVKAMSKIQSHYTSNASSISQKAALAAYNGPATEIEKMRKIFEQRRNFVQAKLNSRPYLSYVYPQGAFYFFINVSRAYNNGTNGQKITNSVEFATYLAEKYQLVTVPGIAFGADDYIRISFASSQEQLEQGVENLIKSMDQLMQTKK
jgi:aspartate aminotransferase